MSKDLCPFNTLKPCVPICTLYDEGLSKCKIMNTLDEVSATMVFIRSDLNQSKAHSCNCSDTPRSITKGKPSKLKKEKPTWSEEELSELKKSWGHKTREDLEKIFPNKSWHQITGKAGRLNLGVRR
jgi:hypothetical protein